MSENLIENTLKEYIGDKNAVFVFPTQIAADLWADRATFVTDCTAVPMEKFMAWDKFKGEAVRGENQDKDSIPSTMRKIFAANLIKENEENPFLKNLIIPEYSKSAGSFVDWIASILPSLGLWKDYFDRCSDNGDEEDQDLLLLWQKYSKFLEKYNLFDPAWEKPPFKNNGSHYYLFFPEILSDWEEYKNILQNSKEFITIISLPENNIEEGTVQLFNNSRVEIKKAVTYISDLHRNEGIEWSEIAVSIPDMDSYGPYVEREMELMEVPYVSRYSRPLSSTGAGSFFSDIYECFSSGFSFDSVKRLVLNTSLPWKEESLCKELIEFGQENHCLCGFEYSGKRIDVWKKSFEENPEEERLRTFYEALQRNINEIVNAESFAKIQEQYFSFRNKFFEMEKCSEKSDRIISRCISELAGIIDLEEKFTECKVPSPYGFFVSFLGSKEYLEQTDKKGVLLLPYKTVAVAPFKCHVVLDASQNSLNVVWKELSFLNDEKRAKLLFKKDENNVTQKFIQLYQMNSMEKQAYFTCGRKTFDGYSQASSYLIEEDKTKCQINDLYPENPYVKEADWFIDEDFNTSKFPEIISKKQKISLERWLNVQTDENTNDDNSADTESLNNDQVFDDTTIWVSSTEMKNFYECPRKWYFSNRLRLRETEMAADLINPFASGNLYHKIMELFCDELKELDLKISINDDGTLEAPFVEILNKVIEKAIVYRDKYYYNSYLTRELFKTTISTIKTTAINCVTEFCAKFAGCKVVNTEASYSFVDEEKDYTYTGRIDCLLQDFDTLQYYLVDFKLGSGGIPSKLLVDDDPEIIAKMKDLPLEEQELPDFQMASYVYLMSRQPNPIVVKNAAFFDVTNAKCYPVFGTQMFRRCPPKKGAPEPDCIEYTNTMRKVIECADNFVLRVKNNDFRINEKVQNYSKCASCNFYSICRNTFNVGKN